MAKVSRANARLFARMHLRQVDTLTRLAGIENGIGSTINGTIPRLIEIVTASDSTPKSSLFGSTMAGALDNVRTMLRKQLIELAKRSHSPP